MWGAPSWVWTGRCYGMGCSCGCRQAAGVIATDGLMQGFAEPVAPCETAGTIIEVNVSELGLVTPAGKVVWGKYAQVRHDSGSRVW